MNTPDLVAPTSDGDDHGAGGEAAEAGSPRMEPGGVRAYAVNSPPPAPIPPPGHRPGPMNELEFDAIVGTIWNGLTDDPFRIGDLLADALGFIAGIALHEDTDPHDAARAAGVLRQMEQRALWGPDHEQEDHR